MYYKCCVRDCVSTRQDAILHRFPTHEKRLAKWLQCLKDRLSLSQKNVFICQKHFEKKFINFNDKLLYKAYPTLFTVEEITSGVPTANRGEPLPELDHNYIKKQHIDHNYHKDSNSIAGPLHKFPPPEFSHTDRFNRWKAILNSSTRNRGDSYIFNSVRLCYRHFEDFFKSKHTPTLTKNAIPTLNLFHAEEDLQPVPSTSIEAQSSNINLASVHVEEPFHAKPSTSKTHSSNITARSGERINLECEAGNRKETSQSTSQRKDWPPTAKRKRDETDDDLTFDDIDLNDQQNYTVELEPEDNYFAIDHEVILDDFDNAIDISTDDNEKEDLDVEIMGEILNEKPTVVHTDFKCNVCHGDISGFRYTCLQCVDWDMCAACEARGEHPAHYVLRIPAPTTHVDCEPVIAGIREQIQNLLQLRKEIKSEIYIKEEADTDEITDDFDPNLTDPILVANDRSVPEIDMHQECSTVNNINTTNPSQENETAGDTHTLDNTDSLSALRNFLVKESTNCGRKQIRIRFKATRGKFSRNKLTQSLKEILESVRNSSVIVQKQNYDDR